MNWLAWPIIPKRLWPRIEYQPKRAITADEHRQIIAGERNAERRNFYELCSHLGGSQTDIANLEAENIDWSDRVITYARRKTGSPAFVHFGPAVETILRSLPYSPARDTPACVRLNCTRFAGKTHHSDGTSMSAGELSSIGRQLNRLRPARSVNRLNDSTRWGAVVACGLANQADKLADEYLRLVEQNASAVVVSQTWTKVHRVNARVRDALKTKGLLGAIDATVQVLDKLDLTNAQKREERFYPKEAVIEVTEAKD